MRIFLYVLVLQFASYSDTLCAANAKSAAQAEAQLIICRRPGFVGGLADFAISIDSVRVAKLSNGRYLSLAVTAGQHIVAAKFLGLTIGSRSKAITVMSSRVKHPTLMLVSA